MVQLINCARVAVACQKLQQSSAHDTKVARSIFVLQKNDFVNKVPWQVAPAKFAFSKETEVAVQECRAARCHKLPLKLLPLMSQSIS
jgi:hypothetical protein